MLLQTPATNSGVTPTPPGRPGRTWCRRGRRRGGPGEAGEAGRPSRGAPSCLLAADHRVSSGDARPARAVLHPTRPAFVSWDSYLSDFLSGAIKPRMGQLYTTTWFLWCMVFLVFYLSSEELPYQSLRHIAMSSFWLQLNICVKSFSTVCLTTWDSQVVYL
jgi:hypothetical protein